MTVTQSNLKQFIQASQTFHSMRQQLIDSIKQQQLPYWTNEDQSIFIGPDINNTQWCILTEINSTLSSIAKAINDMDEFGERRRTPAKPSEHRKPSRQTMQLEAAKRALKDTQLPYFYDDPVDPTYFIGPPSPNSIRKGAYKKDDLIIMIASSELTKKYVVKAVRDIIDYGVRR